MSSTYAEKLEGTQRELGSYFEKSSTVVRSNFQWFENTYARPLITFSLDAFNAHPFVTTFFAIFAGLSFLPVISFLGVTVLTLAGVSFLFFVLAVITVIVLEILFVVLLLTTLTVIAIVSLILTPTVVSSYIFYRLVLHLRNSGPPGLSFWFSETKSLLLGGAIQLPDEKSTTGHSGEGSEVSGDGVLVDGEGVKVEGK